MSNVGTNVQRNVRTNIGFQQWFRSSPSTCYPINNILEYHGKLIYYFFLKNFILYLVNDFGMART
jgi:hypothetical protein